MATSWVYPHQDLAEPPYPDGSRVLRPAVPLMVSPGLHPPGPGVEPVAWTLPLGARENWTLPFGVLLGQRGWFDRFPTRIDASTSTVEVA